MATDSFVFGVDPLEHVVRGGVDHLGDPVVHVPPDVIGAIVGVVVLDVADGGVVDGVGHVFDQPIGFRDVVNLLVNVFGARLRDRGVEVEDVIRDSYEATPEEVAQWCRA